LEELVGRAQAKRRKRSRSRDHFDHIDHFYNPLDGGTDRYEDGEEGKEKKIRIGMVPKEVINVINVTTPWAGTMRICECLRTGAVQPAEVNHQPNVSLRRVDRTVNALERASPSNPHNSTAAQLLKRLLPGESRAANGFLGRALRAAAPQIRGPRGRL
jgi:hypothetical protein